MTTPVDYLIDEDTNFQARFDCQLSSVHLTNCMVALALAKQRDYSLRPPGTKTQAIREAKEVVALATVRHNEAVEALARAYDSALITVHNAVHNMDVKIPRRDKGTVCDPSMESYHQM